MTLSLALLIVVDRLIKSQHTAMLEHATVYLKFDSVVHGFCSGHGAGLKYMNNPYSNAQILCHAPGINGLEHSKRILDEGLYISAEAKIKNGISIESNAEVSSGILSLR